MICSIHSVRSPSAWQRHEGRVADSEPTGQMLNWNARMEAQVQCTEMSYTILELFSFIFYNGILPVIITWLTRWEDTGTYCVKVVVYHRYARHVLVNKTVELLHCVIDLGTFRCYTPFLIHAKVCINTNTWRCQEMYSLCIKHVLYIRRVLLVLILSL